MNVVPIVFSLDNNLTYPACICISSLLLNAKANTFYDIFILHSSKVNLNKMHLDKLSECFDNFNLSYVPVRDIFDSSFEIRGVTIASYYRLLIPEVILDYDQIIYADVDIIFRMDLSALYQLDISNFYIAATKDLGMNLNKEGIKYITSVLGLTVGSYLQAGLILLNSKKIRQDRLVSRFCDYATKKLKYQDQDILNLCCSGYIYFLPPKYNVTNYFFYYFSKEKKVLEKFFDKAEILDAYSEGNIHYNGQKPWRGYCVNFDIWWEYYRKSPFFDEKFYFDFFYNKLNELDQLPLWKRIKILIRYFVYGKRTI